MPAPLPGTEDTRTSFDCPGIRSGTVFHSYATSSGLGQAPFQSCRCSTGLLNMRELLDAVTHTAEISLPAVEGDCLLAVPPKS
jgi:hypothetical protein